MFVNFSHQNIYQSVVHQPFNKMFATRMLFTNSLGQKYNEIRKQILRMLSVIVDIVCLQISTILVFVFPKLICCFTSACKIFFHEQTIYDNFFIYRFRNIQKNQRYCLRNLTCCILTAQLSTYDMFPLIKQYGRTIRHAYSFQKCVCVVNGLFW